jgi:uncharacterized protein with NRDE domain
MCLIALAWRSHPRYELALIANRDESHARPAAPAGADPERPDLYGGRDLAQGGSWLLASTRGRLAAVTNVRVGLAGEAAPRSRGALVRDFAAGNASSADYLAGLASTAGEYGRFNLLLWDGGSLLFASNHPRFVAHRVEPGVHAVSNGAFDARWPKSAHATRALSTWLASPMAEVEGAAGGPLLAPLFDALGDTAPAPDDTLPETGVGLELERTLSPAFVRGEHYGTRCSSVVLAGADAIVFVEHRFGPDGSPQGESMARLPRSR